MRLFRDNGAAIYVCAFLCMSLLYVHLKLTDFCKNINGKTDEYCLTVKKKGREKKLNTRVLITTDEVVVIFSETT